MSIQKNLKKGFTLIELMVVIVIIGILAAVAIPKLFGMSAKAKASEVGPASGTWSKLQSASLVETGCVGNFQMIGYTSPGEQDGGKEKSKTGNFSYESAGSTDKTACTPETASTTKGEWIATNLIALNDCKINTGKWSLTYHPDSSKPSLVTKLDDMADGCGELTPNFDKIR